ncbi:anti-sigma factor [Streptomyces sp. NPDC048002]|uniref:anti-sigma factor n=1 Tax=Streptomyces sp. NPDC048002 TaxID=3154344 RepID=UPI0033FDAD32
MIPEEDPHLAVGAYVLHALPPDEAAAFEKHLADCPACVLETAELSEVAARLACTETAEVPPELLARVLREIGNGPQAPPARPMPGGRRRRVLAWALAASLVVVAGLGGVAAWQYDRAGDAEARADALRDDRQALSEVLTAPDATLHTAELEGGTTAAVVVSRSSDRAAFLAADLPDLDGGQVYELWYAAPSGSLRPAGLMPGSGDRTARTLAGPLGEAVAVGITVEPAGGSEQPTTEPLGIIEIA